MKRFTWNDIIQICIGVIIWLPILYYFVPVLWLTRPIIFQECEGLFVYGVENRLERRGHIYVKENWYSLRQTQVGKLTLPSVTDQQESARDRINRKFVMREFEYIPRLRKVCDERILIEKDPIVEFHEKKNTR